MDRIAANLGIGPQERTSVVQNVLTELAAAELDPEPAARGEEGRWTACIRHRDDLFDYQREVIVDIMSRARPGSVCLLSLPTGAGKTRAAASLVLEDFVAGHSCVARWIAPSVELVDQGFRSIGTLWRQYAGAPVLACSRLRVPDGLGLEVQFGTVQRACNLSDWNLKVGGARRWLIFDEAHQAAAPTFRNVISAAQESGWSIVGLSATPGRYERLGTEDLARLFGDELVIPGVLGSNPVLGLRDRGVLVRPEYVQIIVDKTKPGWFVNELVAEVKSRQAVPSLWFCESVAACHVVQELLKRCGLRSAVVSHETGVGARRSSIDEINSGTLDALINVKVLSTGIDIPRLSGVVIMSKIGSPVLYEQILGRVCRGPSVGGSERAYVFDCGNHAEMFGDMASYSRYTSIAW